MQTSGMSNKKRKAMQKQVPQHHNQPGTPLWLLIASLIVAVALLGGIIYHYKTSRPPESRLHSPPAALQPSPMR